MVTGVPITASPGETVAETKGFAGATAAAAVVAEAAAVVEAAGSAAAETAPDTGIIRKAMSRSTAHAARPLERDISIRDDETVSDISVMGCMRCKTGHELYRIRSERADTVPGETE